MTPHSPMSGVAYNNNNNTAAFQQQQQQQDEDEDRPCRSCHARHTMRIDWAQGDRVCTSCGVVEEERMLDDRPEWKDFGEAEDIIKGLSNARCGLQPNDCSKFVGGLPPTGLSKRPFGVVDTTAADICKSLNTTNRKMDSIMAKQHKRALKRAKLSRMIQKKHDISDFSGDVAPEHAELVLHEEKEAERMYAALHAEKWSLERALLLHDKNNNNDTTTSEEERNDLLARLDAPLKRAASDLYMAYSILTRASNRLKLPLLVTREATNTLVHYATHKDGLTVKGVSSRLSTSSNTTSTSTSSTTTKKDDETTVALRNYNKQKQMAALAAALLFLEARKHGHARLMQEVCASFADDDDDSKVTIKNKHCGKAMNELRTMFPDYMRANTTTAVLSSSDPHYFVEHATRKLKLPPVATACIQALVQEIMQKKDAVNVSATCASVTLFISMVGAVMQRLAQQAAPYQSISPPPKKKKQRLETDTTNGTKSTTKTTSSSTSFDLFAHAALDIKTYEMRQVWDAWSEQVSWSRSVADISTSCQVSQKNVLDQYKTVLYPRREHWLSILAKGNLATPRAKVLLSHVECAGPLLNSQGGTNNNNGSTV